MLLLTATPHRGRTDTFKKLLQLLDEDIFATDDVATERVKELGRGWTEQVLHSSFEGGYERLEW